ncbi:MAG: NUDIX domain-containing protein [Planctomycetota bacterium]
MTDEVAFNALASGEPIERVFRFCPRCGEAHDGIGKIPFRCKSCGMSHFFGPVAAVGALITDEEGRLLLVRRARDPGKGMWGLPGGFVDREETIEQSLAREVMEETGLVLTERKLLLTGPNEYNYEGVIAPVIDLFFLCKVESKQALKLEKDELDHHVWAIPDSEHLNGMAFSSNRLAIEHWLQSS